MEKLLNLIKQSKNIVFLTGAGVSTPSGIPDYRSLQGVYSTKESSEYLLSHSCLINEPDKFYEFVKKLYHPSAKPNIIHKTMTALEKDHNITIITQNIDQLHKKANSSNVIEFHGNLNDLYCMKCHEKIKVEDYLKSPYHDDGGLIRPKVVLYEEMLDEDNINASIQALKTADLVIVVGTSLKVYPFASLVQYANQQAKIIFINKEDVSNNTADYNIIDNAEDVFEVIQKDITSLN